MRIGRDGNSVKSPSPALKIGLGSSIRSAREILAAHDNGEHKKTETRGLWPWENGFGQRRSIYDALTDFPDRVEPRWVSDDRDGGLDLAFQAARRLGATDRPRWRRPPAWLQVLTTPRVAMSDTGVMLNGLYTDSPVIEQLRTKTKRVVKLGDLKVASGEPVEIYGVPSSWSGQQVWLFGTAMPPEPSDPPDTVWAYIVTDDSRSSCPVPRWPGSTRSASVQRSQWVLSLLNHLTENDVMSDGTREALAWIHSPENAAEAKAGLDPDLRAKAVEALDEAKSNDPPGPTATISTYCERRIPATTDAIWLAITDRSSKVWNHGRHKVVESHGASGEVGSGFTTARANGRGRADWTVVESVFGDRLVLHSPSPDGTATSEHRFALRSDSHSVVLGYKLIFFPIADTSAVPLIVRRLMDSLIRAALLGARIDARYGLWRVERVARGR